MSVLQFPGERAEPSHRQRLAEALERFAEMAHAGQIASLALVCTSADGTPAVFLAHRTPAELCALAKILDNEVSDKIAECMLPEEPDPEPA